MRKISNFKRGKLLETSFIFFKARHHKNAFTLLILLEFCTMQSCKQASDIGSKQIHSTQKILIPDSPSPLPKIVYIKTEKVDEVFVWKASNQKMAEMEMSKLALKKGYNQQVRQLARLTTDSDSVANQTLGGITADRNILLLDGLEKNEQQILENLKKVRGNDFDKFYIGAMINSYNKDVMLFVEATRNLKDTALKHFALRTLPVIKSNLSKCRQINGQLK